MKLRTNDDFLLEIEESRDSACQCIDYKSCRWSNDLVNRASSFDKSSPVWTSHKLFLEDKICDYEKQNVYCCGQNGTYPSAADLLELKGGMSEEKVRYQFYKVLEL